jgi:hypothetical protein
MCFGEFPHSGRRAEITSADSKLMQNKIIATNVPKKNDFSFRTTKKATGAFKGTVN